MRLTLLNHKNDITATEGEKYDFVIRIAKEDMKYPLILEWIRQRLIE